MSGSSGHTDATYRADDGVDLYTRSWPLHDNLAANLLIVHGYGEHCARYDPVAERLNREGYGVYSYDQRGHGNSPGRKGHISSFDRLVQDLDGFYRDVFTPACGDAPRFVMGHSMGGLVVCAWVLRHAPELIGLVLSSPGIKAAEKVSPLVKAAAPVLAAIAPHLVVHKLDVSGLSRVDDVVRRYNEDPLVYHGDIGARTGYELTRTIDFVENNLANLTVPFVAFHGTADRLVSVAATRALEQRAGSDDKTIHIYEGGYHELFNDLAATEFFDDLLDWLRTHR